jgi:hypothetical protein
MYVFVRTGEHLVGSTRGENGYFPARCVVLEDDPRVCRGEVRYASRPHFFLARKGQ